MTAQPEQSSLRGIPSVDRVLRELNETTLPRPAVVAVIRRELDNLRATKSAADGAVDKIRRAIEDLKRSRIQTVINGTGIIIHTNFGRSPLSANAIEAMVQAGSRYNNLEYDITGGARGGRAAYLEHNLAILCEAEAATVVNNCAAALVLILRHFTARTNKPEVIVSRGELVQIGGGFRVPEILEASGASLREVGTTNKTTLDDYRRSISDRSAMLLRVHRSNFYMGGFVESPTTADLASVAQEANLPLVVDLGSGATFDTMTLGGHEHEPTPAQTLRDGADLVCLSGDKLLGGPQAGIIAGKQSMVAAIKKEPFFRALRCDKLIMSALQATTDQHLCGQSDQIPIIAMMRQPIEQLRSRAERLVEQMKDLPLSAKVGEGRAQVGGGSLPQTVIPSITIDLLPQGISLEDLATRLRAASPATIGYIADNAFKLDLRTVFDDQDAILLGAIRSAVTQQP